MKSPVLQSIYEKLLYNTQLSPDENIRQFYEATKIQQYEWVRAGSEEDGPYYLVSAWENEIRLDDITMNFRTTFEQELVSKNMDGRTNLEYKALLSKCKELVNTAIHYFGNSHTNITIITKDKSLADFPLILDPWTLPREQFESMERCFGKIIVLFQKLKECIEDEIGELDRCKSVRDHSTYIFVGDKNDISELAAALFASGKLKRRDGKDVKETPLARELAGFFGLDHVDYFPNLQMMEGRAFSSKTKFIDFLKKKLEEYLLERIEKKLNH